MKKFKISRQLKRKQFAFVMNPSKPSFEKVYSEILEFFKEHKLKAPIIKLTTIEQPGSAQALEAIALGADVVVAAGGDGTVRSVACGIGKFLHEGLDTGIIGGITGVAVEGDGSSGPLDEFVLDAALAKKLVARSKSGDSVVMGILPIGTANLYARNLKLKVSSVRKALVQILTSEVEHVDIGWLATFEEPDFLHAFMVIAGVGFDANMVADTNANLKTKIGFLAYFYSGIKNVLHKKLKATLTYFDADDAEYKITTSFRSLMFGNCGRIPGFNLIPNAELNDGLLDIVVIDTNGGILGWGQIFSDMVFQNFGIDPSRGFKIGRIDHANCVRAKLALDRPSNLQIDGELIGLTAGVNISVTKKGLPLLLPEGVR